MMNLVLTFVGLLFVISSDSFKGRDTVGWRIKSVCLNSIPNDKIVNQNILLALPTSIIDDFKLILYIKHWADELVEEGSAMKLQSIPSGVRFCFTSDLKNSLDITVSKIGDHKVAVASQVETDVNNEAIQSLINFAARNIIDSISNNIGLLLTDDSELGWRPPDDRTDFQDSHTIDDSSHSYLLQPSKLSPVTELTEPLISEAVSNKASIDSLDIKSINDFPSVILEIKDTEISSHTLIKYIQTWSDKFAGRGTGVEADNCEDGIIFSFSLSDHLFLVVRVTSLIKSKGLTIYSHKVIAEMKRDRNGEVVVSQGAVISSSSSSKLDDFVVKASISLLKSLLQDLEKLYIPTAVSTTIPKDINSSTKPSAIDFSSPIINSPSLSLLTSDTLSTSLLSSTSTIPFITDSTNSDITGSTISLSTSSSTLSGASGSIEFTAIERSLSYFEEINQELISSTNNTLQTNSHTVSTSASSTASQQQPKSRQIPQSQSQSSVATPRKRDMNVDRKAKEIGLRLENFEGKGLEEQAAEELRNMMRSQKNNGLASYLKSLNTSDLGQPTTSSDITNSQSSSNPITNTVSESFFRTGSKITMDNMKAMLERPYIIQEDLARPVTKLPMDFTGTELKGGYDIFQGPPNEQSGAMSIPSAESSFDSEAARVAKKSIPPNPLELHSDQHKLDFLTSELLQADEMIHDNILNGFKDLLLSDNFLFLMRLQNETCIDYTTRKLYYKMTTKAAELTAELGALVRTESVRHMQTIHDVCEVAVSLQQNEDKFLQELDKIRPRFDTALLGYLEYAIGEEILSLQSKGIDSALHPSTWLQVLRVVQKGVFADFEHRYERLLEPLTMVFRFDDLALQSAVFERFINITPSLDLPLLRELALNVLKGLDSSSKRKEADEPYDSSLIPKINQLKTDIEQYLSEEIISKKLKEIEVEAKRQGKTMELGYSNPVMQAELEARRLQEKESSYEKEGPGLVSKSILETSESIISSSNDVISKEGEDRKDKLSDGSNNTEELVSPSEGRYLLGWG